MSASDDVKTDASKAPAGVDDEMRQKFREALDAKRHRRHASAESAEHDGAEKSHGATGPTKPREFRRKSG